MARPKKIGLDYFPLDCNWDEKMQGLELLHKNDGIVWMIKFWQRAYQTEQGEVDLSGLFGVIHANNCRITIEEHQKIIETCLTLELLIKTETGLYTSNGIKKRIGSVSKERQDAIQRQKESKVKESKVKETPHYSANNSDYLNNNCQTINNKPENTEGYSKLQSFSLIRDAGPESWINDNYRGGLEWARVFASDPSINVESVIAGAVAYKAYCTELGFSGKYVSRINNWLANGEWKTDWKVKTKEQQDKKPKMGTNVFGKGTKMGTNVFGGQDEDGRLL